MTEKVIEKRANYKRAVHALELKLREQIKGFHFSTLYKPKKAKNRGTKEDEVKPREVWVLALSGGLDSISLLHLLSCQVDSFACKLYVFHAHHGDAGSKEQQEFRDKAKNLVVQLCNQLGLELHWVKAHCPLKSEAEFRDWRYQQIDEFKRTLVAKWELPTDRIFVVTAHHEQDLFETRLLRLIRGTGPKGLPSMSIRDKSRGLWRPLLNVSRKELEEYAQAKGVSYVDDPSNEDLSFTRNWLRHAWLPQLEAQNPGAVHRFSESLKLISEALNVEDPSRREVSDSSKIYHPDGGLDRQAWSKMENKDKRQVLVDYLHQTGSLDFGQSHILELMKRLDRKQKRHSFRLLGRSWNICAERIDSRPD